MEKEVSHVIPEESGIQENAKDGGKIAASLDSRRAPRNDIRRFWWIGLIVVAVGLLITWAIMAFIVHPKGKNNDDEFGAFKPDKSENSMMGETKVMSEAQVQAANVAIAQGISIDDPQNDWYKFPVGSIQGDGKPDNPNNYPLAYTDLKNVSFGADADYLYFKFSYYGKMPDKLQQYYGDDMKFFCNNVAISKFFDKSGKSQVGMWQTSVTYIENLEKNSSTEATMHYRAMTPFTAITNMGIQTGTDKNSESMYSIQNSKGLVSGGAGSDYVLAAFPLANLGMKLGDTIEISISYEAASRTYHHESVDLILGKGNNKEGDTIQYVLGTNTYKNLGFKMEAGKL